MHCHLRFFYACWHCGRCLSACAAFDPLILGWLQMHEIEREPFRFQYRLRAIAIYGTPTDARTAPVLRYRNIWQSVESLLLPFAADGSVV
jgi:hypothetical protein